MRTFNFSLMKCTETDYREEYIYLGMYIGVHVIMTSRWGFFLVDRRSEQSAVSSRRFLSIVPWMNLRTVFVLSLPLFLFLFLPCSRVLLILSRRSLKMIPRARIHPRKLGNHAVMRVLRDRDRADADCTFRSESIRDFRALWRDINAETSQSRRVCAVRGWKFCE
jgi:hypothetical protein